MLTKNHLAALNVAYKIASVVSAMKVAALVANTGYAYYYGSNAEDNQVKMSVSDRGEEEEDEKEEEEPDTLIICPITERPIRIPASTRYGNLFERSAIEDFVRKHGKCPLTDQALSEDEVYA